MGRKGEPVRQLDPWSFQRTWKSFLSFQGSVRRWKWNLGGIMEGGRQGGGPCDRPTPGRSPVISFQVQVMEHCHRVHAKGARLGSGIECALAEVERGMEAAAAEMCFVVCFQVFCVRVVCVCCNSQGRGIRVGRGHGPFGGRAQWQDGLGGRAGKRAQTWALLERGWP